MEGLVEVVVVRLAFPFDFSKKLSIYAVKAFLEGRCISVESSKVSGLESSFRFFLFLFRMFPGTASFFLADKTGVTLTISTELT